MLLARLFYFITSEKITDPVYTPDQAPQGTSNQDFLSGFIGNLLHTAFPNLQPYDFPLKTSFTKLTYRSIQIQQFTEGLFVYNHDHNKFKTNIRDFLIQLKEFSGDNAELFAEDREAELKAAREAERERALKVGGLLKPADLDQEDDL